MTPVQSVEVSYLQIIRNGNGSRIEEETKQETTMKNISLSLIALVALSGAAFAQKTEKDDHIVKSGSAVQVEAFEAVEPSMVGNTDDAAREARRLDEKNG
jgi:hypothetical protein